MPAELPFDMQRRGGHMNFGVLPMANKGLLLPFTMPMTDQKTTDAEFLVQVDSSLNELARTPSQGFLEVSSYGFINNMKRDIYTTTGKTMPCGYYYYLITVAGKSYKTGIFKIDNTIDTTGSPSAPGTPSLPIVPKLYGDYNSDYNTDHDNRTT